MKGHGSLGRFGKPWHVKTVKIHILNPLVDRRWDELVGRHPSASVFHQRGWLEALARTYGYEPYILTTAAEGEPLENGIAVCRVSSWMTGTRLVSLPFSDHCKPLLGKPSDLGEFVNWLRAECDLQKWRFRLTRKSGVPIAAMLTVRHRSCVVYKYGCSDERFHSLGGIPFLFWRLVEESKESGADKIDFGRTDLNNDGLIAFKDRFGTTRKLLTYYRYTKTAKRGVASLRDSRAVQRLFSFLPQAVSSVAGR